MATEQVLHVPHSILNSAPISGKLAKLVLLRQYYTIKLFSNILLCRRIRSMHWLKTCSAMLLHFIRWAAAIIMLGRGVWGRFHGLDGGIIVHAEICGVANSFKQVTFWPLPHPLIHHHSTSVRSPWRSLAKFWGLYQRVLGCETSRGLGCLAKWQALLQSQHGCRYYTWRAKMGRAVQLSS